MDTQKRSEPKSLRSKYLRPKSSKFKVLETEYPEARGRPYFAALTVGWPT